MNNFIIGVLFGTILVMVVTVLTISYVVKQCIDESSFNLCMAHIDNSSWIFPVEFSPAEK
jgi:hypothetical protein